MGALVHILYKEEYELLYALREFMRGTKDRVATVDSIVEVLDRVEVALTKQ